MLQEVRTVSVKGETFYPEDVVKVLLKKEDIAKTNKKICKKITNRNSKQKPSDKKIVNTEPFSGSMAGYELRKKYREFQKMQFDISKRFFGNDYADTGFKDSDVPVKTENSCVIKGKVAVAKKYIDYENTSKILLVSVHSTYAWYKDISSLPWGKNTARRGAIAGTGYKVLSGIIYIHTLLIYRAYNLLITRF